MAQRWIKNRMGRWIALALVAVGMMYGVSARADNSVDCASPTYDFGQKRATDVVDAKFVLKNTGPHELRFKKIRADWNRDGLEVPSAGIAPGAEFTLTVTLPLRLSRGKVIRRVFVEFDNPDVSVIPLQIEGEVVAPVIATPELFNFGKVAAISGASKSLDLVPRDADLPFHISGLSTSRPDAIDVSYASNEKGYRITVTLRKSLLPGELSTELLMLTDNKLVGPIVLPISAQVEGDLAVSPHILRVVRSKDIITGEMKPQQAVILTINPDKVKTFKITAVDVPDPTIHANIQANDTGGYRISLTGLGASSKVDGKVVVVKTDVESMREIRIPISLGSALPQVESRSDSRSTTTTTKPTK